MRLLKKFPEKSPVLFSLLVIVLTTVLMEHSFSDFFVPILAEPYADYIAGLLVQGLAALFLALLAGGIGLRGLAAFSPPVSWKTGALLSWPLFVLCLLAISDLFTGAVHPAPGWILPVVLFY